MPLIVRSTLAIPTRYRDVTAPPGSLHVVCGCMFAGKTETLIDHISDLDPHRVQTFKPAIDNRYHPTRVVSHRGRSVPARPVDSARRILAEVPDTTGWVAVDECHFFDKEMKSVCAALVKRGKSVLVAGLDRDCWSRPFPLMTALCESADLLTRKLAMCARCHRQADRTQRLTPILNGVLVGGAESFEPRCAQCWSPPPISPDQITRRASNTGPWAQHSS